MAEKSTKKSKPKVEPISESKEPEMMYGTPTEEPKPEPEKEPEPELEPESVEELPPVPEPPMPVTFGSIPTGGKFICKGMLYQKVTLRENPLCGRPLAGEGDFLHPAVGDNIILDANTLVIPV